MGDGIPSSSFDDGLIEGGVVIAMDGPILFVPLAMVGFLLSKNRTMLETKFLLNSVILFVRWLGLMDQELVFNSIKLFREFRLASAPRSKIRCKEIDFLVKGPVDGFGPAVLSYLRKITFKKPPILKAEWFFGFGAMPTPGRYTNRCHISDRQATRTSNIIHKAPCLYNRDMLGVRVAFWSAACHPLFESLKGIHI